MAAVALQKFTVRILPLHFDHNLDWRLYRYLQNHEVKSVLKMGWAELENGDLLDEAEREGFNDRGW